MQTLTNFLWGEWVLGQGVQETLLNPATEQPLINASSLGLDVHRALQFARDVGGPTLRSMTFRARGSLLRTLSRSIHGARDELLQLAITNGGNTRSDAKFDIDGASATLAAYADLGDELGEQTCMFDGTAIQLGRSPKLVGQHILTPLQGVAVHINAFNFPAWGLAEKTAVALLAGMPILSKPATSTALVAHRIVERWHQQNLLPKGVFSLLVGDPGELITYLKNGDVVAFTGSNATGIKIQSMPNIIHNQVRINIEADSLNAAIVGPDVEINSELCDLFIRDVVREVAQKAGQKCTAIRRIFVASHQVESIREVLSERLTALKVGNPSHEDVEVGPVATRKQYQDVLQGIQAFVHSGARIVVGGGKCAHPIGVELNHGFFVNPTLLETNLNNAEIHTREVFGPVTTLMPYESINSLCEAVRSGGGGLVTSVYSDDSNFVRDIVGQLACTQGRIVIANHKIVGVTLPPSMVLPQLVHGGPGRAGGGEELGGLRGLALYQQRTALQGYGPWLSNLVSTPSSN